MAMKRSSVLPKNIKRLCSVRGQDALQTKVALWRGDITRLEFDAIVNAANKSLLGGGGVDGAIHAAAGRKLLKECMSLNGCETGEAKITAGYNLPAKHVIHTVGPIGENPTLLSNCYKSCLDLMLTENLQTIAFPCISTGIYGYPNEEAAKVALGTTKKWLKKHHSKVDLIVFCIFLKADDEIYKRLATVFFPATETLASETEKILAGNEGQQNQEYVCTSDNQEEIQPGSVGEVCEENVKSSEKYHNEKTKVVSTGKIPAGDEGQTAKKMLESRRSHGVEDCTVDNRDAKSQPNDVGKLSEGNLESQQKTGIGEENEVGCAKHVQAYSEESEKSEKNSTPPQMKSALTGSLSTMAVTESEVSPGKECGLEDGHLNRETANEKFEENWEAGNLYNSKELGQDVLSEEARRRWIKKFESSEIEALEKVVTVDIEHWAVGSDAKFSRLKLVAGLDVSYHKEKTDVACVTLAILSFPELKIVYQDTTIETVNVPYIPGYLGYREAYHFKKKISDALKSNFRPQVIFVDGNGMLHPRKFGSAVQVGVGSDICTIGVAKSLLVMQDFGINRDSEHAKKIEELEGKGSTFDLVTKDGLLLGKALRTSSKSKQPVYVSVGHRCSLETAVRVTLACSEFRVPEPIRQADHLSKMKLREEFYTGGSKASTNTGNK